ncbi:MAG: restriction endonuclease subunit M [Alistipes sp.]|nr:restriction endonuclease subunit M [Alistipes sp.]
MSIETIDILEDGIPKTVLDTLLQDHSTQKNIFWGTADYEHYGEGFGEYDEITYEKICDNTKIIPRVLKNRSQQNARSKDMAEVFTPSWVCNAQNNLVDNAWFGREGVFNTEMIVDGTHTWEPTETPIIFPDGKTWMDYVRDNRMEITCGEAPYLTSRYDTTTGERIPVERRIGLLDRKLRVINENVSTSKEWLSAARIAYMSTYGYEWQGDNLLLAREALYYTFVDNFVYKFNKKPNLRSLMSIAEIISWNLWQMDGIKGVVPGSCMDMKITEYSLFGTNVTIQKCKGCETNDISKHNGIYCTIKDWKSNKTIQYIDLINQ